MTEKDPYARFARLGFDDFRRMAADPTLSRYEKIGFPDTYRSGRESQIHEDIVVKVPALAREGTTIVDIGPGCSDLPHLMIEQGAKLGQRLVFIDSAEMLAQLPDDPAMRKVAAYFPNCPELINELRGRADGIVVYSVLHYVFAESNLHAFLDSLLELLAPGGRLLVGDIPNVSMRKRFFASLTGRAHHRAFTGRDEDPVVAYNAIEHERIDDSVVLALAARARSAGFHGWVVPQAMHLPMANRREDLLIERP